MFVPSATDGVKLTQEQFRWLKAHMRPGEWQAFKRDYGLPSGRGHRDRRRSKAAKARRGIA